MKDFIKKIVDSIIGFFEWLGEMWDTDDTFRGIYLFLVIFLFLPSIFRRR